MPCASSRAGDVPRNCKRTSTESCFADAAGWNCLPSSIFPEKVRRSCRCAGIWNCAGSVKDMADIQRISVREADAKTKANQALLVCAYEDKANARCSVWKALCRSPASNRGYSLYQSRRKSSTLEVDRAKQAARLRAQGFENVTALKGDVEAWKAAGYAMN